MRSGPMAKLTADVRLVSSPKAAKIIAITQTAVSQPGRLTTLVQAEGWYGLGKGGCEIGSLLTWSSVFQIAGRIGCAIARQRTHDGSTPAIGLPSCTIWIG